MTTQRRLSILVGLAFVLIIGSLSTAAILHAETAQIPTQAHDFVDVPVADKEWMAPFIDAFYHQGVTGGCANPPLQYCPEQGVTRAEMAVFIGRALGYVDAVNAGFNTEAYFKNTSASSAARGVVGETIDGAGVYGRATDDGYGVYGYSQNDIGVYASSATSIALWAWSSSYHGIYAYGFGNDPDDQIYDIELSGPYGEIHSSNLMFQADHDVYVDLDNNGGNASAFRIRNDADATVFSITEAGNFFAAGSKSSIVDTVSYGTRALYAIEGTGVWFEDAGRAQLENGEVTITFDAIFAETVNLDEDYEVFLTPIGDWADLYVTEMTATSFTVRAADGRSSIEFSYRVLAKRMGYEDVRLEEAANE